jgi:hypothetical protein
MAIGGVRTVRPSSSFISAAIAHSPGHGENGAAARAGGAVGYVVGSPSADDDERWHDGGVVQHFLDDDNRYTAWLAAIPPATSSTVRGNPKPNYVMLHRADCSSINPSARRVSWTRLYRKVCAGSVAELDDWARGAVGTTPSRCGMCHP